MAVLLENSAVKWLLEQLSPSVIALLFISLLIIWLTLRVNRLITSALSQEAEQTQQIAIAEKRISKLQQLLSSAPCISKNNATWLQDDHRNGGQPAEQIKCQYFAAKERGEK